MEKLSNNFTYEELIYSATANRLKISNIPSKEQKEKLRKLAQTILQPIRDKWNNPIIVTSGYRSYAVNKAVGGAKTSQHMQAEAADIKVGGIEQNKKLFNMILDMINKGQIKVGQLIDEYNYSWIHVSLPRVNKVNNQILHIK